MAERGDGTLVGSAACEPDESLGRAWIYGPLVDGDDWDGIAEKLLVDLMSAAPEAIVDFELTGDTANLRLANLADRHGFVAGPPHFVLALDAALVEQPSPDGIVPLPPDREHEFIALHDLLFPGTYYPGAQLVERAVAGKQVVLVLATSDELVGYAAGRVDEAGDGYIDFVGVQPARRREGHGRKLVVALCDALRRRHSIPRVTLTVSSENAAALALYDGLGFERDSSAVGYRLRPEG